MRNLCLTALLLAAVPTCLGQGNSVSLPELIQGAQQWAQENLDTNVLNNLSDADQQKVNQFFQDLQQQFQGEYVINLAALRGTAENMLPLLKSDPDTQPYAAWLQPRLDFLQVADELRISIPPPAAGTNQPSPPMPNPAPDKERAIWVKKVANRPWPPAAKELVPQLKPLFKQQDVPDQLVWLAEVESGFDATARSPAGAAGLFQLMPDTAKRFGLSTWPRDQRLQTDPSATASAEYLKSLHDRFQDWRLAVAAYNAGEGTVQKLLDRHNAHTYDDIATYLPAETQLYVPKVEAILQEREGVSLAQLPSTAGS